MEEIIKECISEYFSTKGYNMFELYNFFSTKTDETMLELLYNLVKTRLDDTNLPNQYKLIYSLIHYLEYKGLTSFLFCNCDSYFHLKLPKSNDDKPVHFLFQYKNSGILLVKMDEKCNINYQITNTKHLPVIKSTRIDSNIAIGHYGKLKRIDHPVFRVKNMIKTRLIEEANIGKKISARDIPKFRHCETHKLKEENGLIDIYRKIVKRCEELPKCNHLPPKHIVDDITDSKGRTSFVILEQGQAKNYNENDIVTKLSISLELYLHYLHHHDPLFDYFQYISDESEFIIC